jgi:hypothetical protein
MTATFQQTNFVTMLKSECGWTAQGSARRWGLDREGQIVIAINPNPVPKPLPADIQEFLRSERVSLRRAAVDELELLLRSGDQGMIIAARQALMNLTNDDSARVSNAARLVLQGSAELVPKQLQIADRNLQVDSELVRSLWAVNLPRFDGHGLKSRKKETDGDLTISRHRAVDCELSSPRQ